jgi:hypothetical protein
MSHGHHLPEGRSFIYSRSQRILHLSLAAIGLLLAVGGFVADPARAWKTVLIGYMFVTYLGLGAAFTQGIQYISNAAWGVGFRRVNEAMVNILPISFVLYIPLVLIGHGNVWAWMDPDSLEHSLQYFLYSKHWYLNVPGFMFRDLVFIGLVIVVTQLWRRWSLAQDKTGDEKYTWWSLRLAAAFLVLWAPGISIFGFDMLMSLDFKWFSSMFGVYTFVGCFQSALAMLTLFTLWHRRPGGSFEGVVGKNNIHDLGKFLFGFTVFWAYIAFSQMLIIWYANLPEETIWFRDRWEFGWAPVSLALIVFHFVFPFFFLMRRKVKRNPKLLAFAAVWLLFAQAFDLYWLTIPTLTLNGGIGPQASLFDAGPLLAYLGVFLFVVQTAISRHKTVPSQDPRYDEFLHLHQ